MAIQSTSTKRVVIQENIPAAAVDGLAEAIQRYYITPNMQFIEPASFRRVDSQGTVELYWRFKLHEGGATVPLAINLSISQPAVELRFEALDVSNSQQVALSSRVIDDLQSIVWQYMQNTKSEYALLRNRRP